MTSDQVYAWIDAINQAIAPDESDSAKTTSVLFTVREALESTLREMHQVALDLLQEETRR